MPYTSPGSPGGAEAKAVENRVAAIVSRLKGIKDEVDQREVEKKNLLEELEAIKAFGSRLMDRAHHVIEGAS